MENTTMIKKEYQKPSIEFVEADIEQEILTVSLKSVKSSGLDSENELLYDDEGTGGDQSNAW